MKHIRLEPKYSCRGGRACYRGIPASSSTLSSRLKKRSDGAYHSKPTEFRGALSGDADFLLGGGEDLFDREREHCGGVRVQTTVSAAEIIRRLRRNVLDHSAARERAVAPWISGAKKTNDTRAERSSQMQRTGITGDNETRLSQERGERLNRERNDRGTRGTRRGNNFAGEAFFAGRDIYDRAKIVTLKKRGAERTETVRRPTFRFPAAARTDDNVFAGNAFTRECLAERAQFIFRDTQRKARFGLRLRSSAHGEIDGHVNDMAPGGNYPVGIKDSGAGFARGLAVAADASRRAGEPGKHS